MAGPSVDDTGHDAPEVNPQQGCLYAVADHAPTQPATSTKEPYYDSAPPAPHGPQTTTRQSWRRWWLLLVIGLFIAVVAGVVGGFIGQAMQKERIASSPDSSSSSAAPSSVPSNGSSTAVTPPAHSAPGTVGTIIIPQTGCDFPASRARRRIINETVYTQTSYIIICKSGWADRDREDDIIAIWTLTPSDCIEACISQNIGRVNERICKGAGFIPSWTDQKEAAKVLNGSPRNCFLKNTTTGIGPNDREAFGIEIVALCMQGQCDGIGIS